jgi:hypothetical protein
MSTFRKAFRLTVDGVPHDIVTSARDYAAIEVADGDAPLSKAMTTWTMLHAACMRLEVPGIPHDVDKFIDLLDDIDDLDGVPVGVPSTGNPTHVAESGA